MALSVAVLLGLRHATDPDHLTAVSTLVLGDRHQGTRRAGALGLAWGLGHAATLFAFGLPVILVGRFLPEAVTGAAEMAIGVVIVALAARLLLRTLRDLVATATRTGEADQLATSARDIERTVGTLAVERARFGAVLEGMADGVVATDPSGRVTLMNRAAHELFGAGPDATGRSLLEVVRVPALDELVSGDSARGEREIEVEVPATPPSIAGRTSGATSWPTPRTSCAPRSASSRPTPRPWWPAPSATPPPPRS